MKSLLEREVKLTPPPGLDLDTLDGERVPPRELDADRSRHDPNRQKLTISYHF
jgi:hypothetical protein